jgi:hypothetical protein
VDCKKKILVKFSNFSGVYLDEDCWRVLTLPSCTEMSKCCDSADVVVIKHPGNDNEKTCCYKFNINNVGCNVAEVKIYDGLVSGENLMATKPTSIITVRSEIIQEDCHVERSETSGRFYLNP